MCSRYELNARARDLVARFALIGAAPTLPNKAELRPTNQAPVIVASAEGPTARSAAWGLPAPWDGKPLINARAETLDEKKTFRPLLENRCLVPATAYFEWRKVGRERHRNRITTEGTDVFAFAGLFDDDGHFTIVTCVPTAEIAHIHGRMPVILVPSDEQAWIDPNRPFHSIAPSLIAYDESPLAAVEDAPPQSDLFG